MSDIYSNQSWHRRFYEENISNFEDDKNDMATAMLFARHIVEIQKDGLPRLVDEDLLDKIAVKVGYEVISAILEIESSENFNKTVWKCQREAAIVYRVTYYLYLFSRSQLQKTQKSKSQPISSPNGMVSALDMGLGKTIAALLMLYVSHNSERIVAGDEEDDWFVGKAVNEVDAVIPRAQHNNTSLVFVPPNLLVEWEDALKNIFGSTVTVLKNPTGITNMDQFVDGDCKVILLSVNMLQNSDKMRWFKENTWLNLVVDEAHIGVGSKNNPNTKVNAAKIDAVSRLAITATPDQGHIDYMISLLEFCGVGISKQASVDQVKMMCARHMFRISKDNAKDDIGECAPPEPEYVTLVVDAAADADPKNEAFSLLIAKVNEYERLDSRTAMKISLARQVVVNPKAAFDKRGNYKPPLDKLANELPTIEELPEISPVIQKMVEYIASCPPDEKHVVMCHFVEELNWTVAALQAANIRSFVFSGDTSPESKNAYIKTFKNFKKKRQLCPVLVCNIQCGSVGLNLQCANNIYFPTSDWNHQRELQAVARLNRSGQKNVVRVVFIRHHRDATDGNIQAIQYRKIQHCNGILGESRDVDRHIQRLREGEALAKKKAADALALIEDGEGEDPSGSPSGSPKGTRSGNPKGSKKRRAEPRAKQSKRAKNNDIVFEDDDLLSGFVAPKAKASKTSKTSKAPRRRILTLEESRAILGMSGSDL